MYSQNDEERHILEGLGDFVGRFLDVGAANGKTFSNTQALAELGWSGVCVEPSPWHAAKLTENYRDNQKITIIAAALGLERGLTALWATEDLVSTTEYQFMKLWESDVGSPYRKIMVPQVTWKDLSSFGPFSMINIDTEGTSIKLYDAMPRSMVDEVRVICAEHNGDMRSLQPPAGFKVTYQSAENFVMVRKQPKVVTRV